MPGNPEDLIAQEKNLPINGRRFESLQAVGGVAQADRVMRAAAPMAKAASEEMVMVTGREEPPIRTRENFDALATFAAAVPTDSDGRASVKVKLPDNLTRY